MFDQTTNTETHQLTVGKIETANGTIKPQLLRDAVKRAVTNFFAQMDGQEAEEVYEMVLSEVEAPLLDIIMQHTRGNQTRAANMLGINRGTLRKKLKKYGMN
ncbi:MULTISPECIES: DNA-binding transcriptional regulator Fis [Shewanella]|jgi:Fis family transcriptional regulator|uniref:DNA-binding protein Fis n=12 Tax=Shewanella TaxID=22 RepID=FIS_SHESH|nr:MULTISPECIES: DNA-binding transcriptional regulator Fis [Shewanella]A8G0V0.1 RecName: Full=DNA-binding protein Fis [Shewanella sediminis HAW-EB3]B1KQE6.1 RecName: Full=DNA-binding protein Fis [Shewanella woodyi ATCC 51908]ABV38723.1 transcriptional regulator, fis family [Shewanella sediminis HAW-EB3]ACA84801.1 transcriptional regulator, Fis family [Shewanella woodyi ATCC 51908]AQS38226.1 Factor for inversion stimulation Fis, transcriptional activator [Shewanella psychrophila]EDQ02623.1 DNA